MCARARTPNWALREKNRFIFVRATMTPHKSEKKMRKAEKKLLHQFRLGQRFMTPSWTMKEASQLATRLLLLEKFRTVDIEK